MMLPTQLFLYWTVPNLKQYLSGYIFSWAVFSVFAMILQLVFMNLGWLVHQKLNPENVVLFLLLIAGIYQFVNFKNGLCGFKPKNSKLSDGMNVGWRGIGSGFWLTCLLFVGGVMNIYI